MLNSTVSLALINVTDNESVSNISLSTDNSATLPWSFNPIAELIITILTILTNGYLLTIFATHRHLRTPFSIYIINLLLADFIYAITYNPWDIINDLYPNWILGYHMCNLYIYSNYVISGIVMNSHALITLNRLWAITWPISYKQHHNHQVAIAICFAMVGHVHLITLPGVVVDAVYYRSPTADTCALDTSTHLWVWSTIVEFVVYDWPIGIVLAAYPFLWWRKRQRHRQVRVQHRPLSVNTVSVRVTSDQLPSNTTAPGTRTTRDHIPLQEMTTKTSCSTMSGRRVTMQMKVNRESSRGFIVLTCLTISLLVCWAPVQIIYAIETFVDVNLMSFDKVALVMYSVQAVLDPVLFAMTLKDLRDAIKNTLGING